MFKILIGLLITIFIGRASSLKVDIEGVRSSKGMIYVGIFNNSKTFLTMKGLYRWMRVRPKRGRISCKFRNIPRGRYAVALFHDENGNEELDMNSMGFPKEGYAISGRSGFGMPSFKECSFPVNSNKRYRVHLKMHY
jgi:uncharacterized protein (DUF2141 family)